MDELVKQPELMTVLATSMLMAADRLMTSKTAEEHDISPPAHHLLHKRVVARWIGYGRDNDLWYGTVVGVTKGEKFQIEWDDGIHHTFYPDSYIDCADL